MSRVKVGIGDLSLVEAEIASISSHFSGRGISIELGSDFDWLQGEITKIERGPLLRQFDPKVDLSESEEAFWVCGFDQDGVMIFTSAVQLLNLTGSSVAEYIENRKSRLIPASPLVKTASVQTFPGPKAKRLTGRVVYHGEVWLHRSLRDKGTAHLVVRLGMLCATSVWDPDVIFGLMNWVLACDGFNSRIGYTHCEPMASTWEKQEGESQHQIWTVYEEREDLNFWLNMSAVSFAETLNRNFK